MVYIFYGADDFSLREAVAALKAGLGDPSLLAWNTSVLDGPAITFAELQAHCETVPFLGPARLVIVEGLLGWLAASARDRSAGDGQPAGRAGAWTELPDLLRRLPPTTTLVLIEGILDGAPALLRSLGELAEVREFRPLRGTALQQWIRDRVQQCGGRIAPGAVRLLADLMGENLWAMAAEVDKLCTYALGRSITVEDVHALTVGVREASIFALVDAVVGRSLPQASRTLRRLLEGGAAPAYILFMLARQVRALLLAKDALEEDRRLPEAEIGRRIGITHPYALGKTLAQARQVTLPQLMAAHHRLLEADVALKTGRLAGDLAVELLMVDLCRAGTGATAASGSPL